MSTQLDISDNVRRFVKEHHDFDPQAMILVEQMNTVKARQIMEPVLSGRFIILGNIVILENPSDAVTVTLLPLQESK